MKKNQIIGMVCGIAFLITVMVVGIVSTYEPMPTDDVDVVGQTEVAPETGVDAPEVDDEPADVVATPSVRPVQSDFESEYDFVNEYISWHRSLEFEGRPEYPEWETFVDCHQYAEGDNHCHECYMRAYVAWANFDLPAPHHMFLEYGKLYDHDFDTGTDLYRDVWPTMYGGGGAGSGYFPYGYSGAEGRWTNSNRVGSVSSRISAGYADFLVNKDGYIRGWDTDWLGEPRREELVSSILRLPAGMDDLDNQEEANALIDRVRTHLGNYDARILELLIESGSEVQLFTGQLTDLREFSNKRGIIPPGYVRAGWDTTYDEIDGVASGNRAYVAMRSLDDDNNNPEQRCHCDDCNEIFEAWDSATGYYLKPKTLRHEIGHLIDRALGSVSSSQEFRDIRDREKDELFDALWLGKSTKIYADDASEYFAITFEIFFSERRDELRQNAYETYAFLQDAIYGA